MLYIKSNEKLLMQITRIVVLTSINMIKYVKLYQLKKTFVK